ncbi:MAG: hypothetical protein QXL94_09345 [Candidatus Parvarchaeum sp.]
MDKIDVTINEIINEANPFIKHNDTVSQIEHVFRKNGFYTTREYPIYEIKDGSSRAGRIDLVARKGKFRVAVEYDHHEVIKWKSFQKIVQIKPDVAIGIAGKGDLEPNLERAEKYLKYLKSELYVISLKQRKYQKFERQIK